MSKTKTLKVQQGIWIDEQWLQSAGLGSSLKVVVQSGEIRIVAAPMQPESKSSSKRGWEIFRSLGKNASVGKLPNAGMDHDKYLYGKKA